VQGDAATPLQVAVDAVTMTGNVVQVFLGDAELSTALGLAWQALRPGGHLILETRDPAAHAWHGWTRERTTRTVRVEGVGEVVCWENVTTVEWPTVSFQTAFRFADDSLVTSSSTLRFRSRDEMMATLLDAHFEPAEVRGAPDRPGLELVFIARRPFDSL
jgi:hypothetical protein